MAKKKTPKEANPKFHTKQTKLSDFKKVESSVKQKHGIRYCSFGKNKENQAKLLKLLSECLPIKTITKLTGKSLSTVYQSFSTYRKRGWIDQERYLTQAGLKITESYYRCVLKHGIKGSQNKKFPMEFPMEKSNQVRLHNLAFKLKVYSKTWKANREKLLELRNIKYTPINMGFWKIDQITIDNFKIWLNPKHIIFYMKNYYGDIPLEAFSAALDDLKELVIKLQRNLGIRLFNPKYLDFEISRQHYALVKNQLAEQYNKEKKKLFVYDDRNELRLLIDDSLNLKELETVHKEKAMTDNEKVQRFFREDIIEKDLTLSSIYNNHNELAKRTLDLSDDTNNLSVVMEQMNKNITKLTQHQDWIIKRLDK